LKLKHDEPLSIFGFGSKLRRYVWDCNMPVLDGWGATREIQAVMGHKTPIIAVTANAMKGDREICLEAGMDDYITKPVKHTLLLDVICKWISHCHDRDALEEHVHAQADAGAAGRRASRTSLDIAWEVTEAPPKRLLAVPAPSPQPVEMLTSLQQVERCRRAALTADTEVLGFEAHSMKGGAAVCFAVELAAACARLEDLAKGRRVPRDSASPGDGGGFLGSPRTTFTEHDWALPVEDVAQALEKLAHYVKAVGAMHMLPYHELKERCGDHTDDIVAALSALLEAAVRAYIAAHAAVMHGSEETVEAAMAALESAAAAAQAVSADDLAGGVENKHSTDVDSPAPRRVGMNIDLEGITISHASISVRVLVLNDPPAWLSPCGCWPTTWPSSQCSTRRRRLGRSRSFTRCDSLWSPSPQNSP
jgi:CheY-like chemotaxis protein